MVSRDNAAKLLILLTGILNATNSWYRSSFAPIIDILQTEFNATSGQIGLMTALFWFGYVILQIPSGLVLQYVTVEFALIISASLSAVAMFLFAIPINIDSVVFPSIIMIVSGILTAPVFLASCKLIAQKLGSNAVPFVGGLIEFFIMAAVALGNFLQAFLWQEYAVWREMYFGCSVLTAALFIAIYAIEFRMKSTNSVSPESKAEAETEGDIKTIDIEPVSSDKAVVSNTTNLSSKDPVSTPNEESSSITTEDTRPNSVYLCGILVIQPVESQNTTSSTNLPVYKAMKLALTNPWNWILGLHWFSVLTINIALYPIWFISYMSLKFGYSRETATLINGLYFAFCAIGSVILGKLSTKYKRRKIFYIISSVGLLSPLYIMYCGPDAHIMIIIACNVIAGFCSGIASIEFGLVREYNEYDGTSDAAGGIVNSLGLFLSGTVMPWVMGMMMDRSWSRRDGQINDDTGDRVYSLDDYNTAFLVIPAVIVVNWCTTLLMKETNGKAVQRNGKREGGETTS